MGAGGTGKENDMLIAFELSMPNKASWNGKWSGEGRPYVKIRDLPKSVAYDVLIPSQYHYQCDDGWCACVSVCRVNSKEAERLRKKSVGFYGYDWMIESIISNGKILTKQEATHD